MHPTRGKVLSKLLLNDIAVLTEPSFISAAYVQQMSGVEMWVVSVYGQIFSAADDQDTASINMCIERTLSISILLSLILFFTVFVLETWVKV